MQLLKLNVEGDLYINPKHISAICRIDTQYTKNLAKISLTGLDGWVYTGLNFEELIKQLEEFEG